MIPLLLRPKLLGWKNRFFLVRRSKTLWMRDFVLLLFSVGLALALFQGTVETLSKIHLAVKIAYIPPVLPLGLVFVFLMAMLVFSNSVSALGSLFLSHDLDLVLASPIKPMRLFLGKLLEVTISSSWMALVFGVPVVAGFGASYHAPFSYYVSATAILIPYFIIPSALSVIFVTLFARCIPATRTREILLVCCGLAFIGVYLLIKIIFEKGGSLHSIQDILNMVKILTTPNQPWMPSYWAAAGLGEILMPTGRGVFPYLSMLYTVAGSLVVAAYLLMRIFHSGAYSMAKSARNRIRLNSKSSQKMLGYLLPGISPPSRAFIAKELKIFSRDMTQAVQLLLLLGLCMIYLYNFKVLHAVEGVPESMRAWWQGFLIISNISMGAFVVTAVGTRFVFPSISLEGQAYWILQSSPVKMEAILRAKFWAWYIPVATISSVLFATGAFTINAEPTTVVLSVVAGWVFCYGILSLAVGLGALFANFTWEHASQLAASFGSLVYMLTSTILIGLTMLPVTLLIIMGNFQGVASSLSPLEWYSGVVALVALIIYLHFVTARWALAAGKNALLDRMQ